MGLVIRLGAFLSSKVGLLAGGLLGFIGGGGVSGVSRLVQWGAIAFVLWFLYENLVKGK